MEILDAVTRPDPWSDGERARLERLCAVVTGDPAAAADLAQETLLEAWRIRHRLVDPSGASRWLDAVARNVCHRWRVDRARRLAHEQVTDVGPDQGAHDPIGDLLEHHEMVELLDRALARLPEPTRAALVGRYVEGLAPHELAAHLRTSPEAVSMRLVRGRARLRELMEGELADEPVARVWVDRHGAAWRPTRLPCPTCGRAAVAMQRDRREAAIRWRCERCDGGGSGVSAQWSTDNPAFAPRLGDAQRPSTVIGRMADWAHGWWPAAIETGAVACTRCGHDARVSPYVREERSDDRTRRGWVADCDHCGEQLSTSLLGLLLVRPEARGLRERRPRTHAVPTRATTADGRTTLVVGLRDDASGDGLDAVYDARTTRLLAVVAAR